MDGKFCFLERNGIVSKLESIDVMELTESVKGKWDGIFVKLIPQVLVGRWASCPRCGGVDRFRVDIENGSAVAQCNGCHPARNLSGFAVVAMGRKCTLAKAIKLVAESM
jgi:phage/plasmid primase-like uncharacterized protein